MKRTGEIEASKSASGDARMEKASNRRWVPLTIRTVLAVSLIGALLLWNNTAVEIWANLRSVTLHLLPLMIAGSLALNFISAYKWKLILSDQRRECRMTSLFGLYLAGKFFSNFSLGMIGGDVVRSAMLGNRIQSQVTAAASVFFERFTGFLTLVTLVVLFAVFNTEQLREPIAFSTVLAALGLCTILLLTTLNPGWLVQLTQIFQEFGCFHRLHRIVTKLDQELAAFRNNLGLWFATLTLSVLFYALTSLVMYLASTAIGLQISFLQLMLIIPLIFLVSAIPVSPSNIGWWEWCVGIFFVQAGATLAEGVSVGIVIRAVTLIVSLLGGVYLVFRSGERWKR